MINTHMTPPSTSGYYLTYPWPDADPSSGRVLHYRKESGEWSRNAEDAGVFYPVAAWKTLTDEPEPVFEDHSFEIFGRKINVRATSRINAALKLENALNELLDAEGID